MFFLSTFGSSPGGPKAAECTSQTEDTLRPTAGQSTKRVPVSAANTSDIPQSWSACDPSSFHLRSGADYASTRRKEPSKDSFYDLVGIDFFKCGRRIDDIGSKVDFPADWLSFEDDVGNDSDLPTILIVNAQLPSDFSPSLFTEVSDGDGWSMVFYFKIKESTLRALRDPLTTSGSLSLLRRYLTEGPVAFARHAQSSKNAWLGRFKVMARIENIDAFALPSFITAYNAKPVLIRTTGHLLRGLNYVEMDINVHKFGNVPKQALQVMFSRFGDMHISVGFCVESREDAEMPETLFGTGTLHLPQHQQALRWPA